MSHLTGTLAILGAPPDILSALELLQFRNPSAISLGNLGEHDRQLCLEWCDRKQITLLLGALAKPSMPEWLFAAVRSRHARYVHKFERMKNELFQIAEAFEAAHLEFAMLKGLSHAPMLSPAAPLRVQGDIDLWLPGKSAFEARDILAQLGYVPLLHSKTRHLAPMGKPSKWKWRGDMFDPEMPISVELHYELWSEETEHFAVPGLNEFWTRRRARDFDGHCIPVLCDEDLVAFSTLHLLLHLLHGELPLQRAWEIARFLHTHAADERFWASWRTLHSPPLKQLEIFVLRLVSYWFDCDYISQLEEEFEQLPPGMKRWFKEHALSPLKREWAPNKSELWLHLALLSNSGKQCRVFFRRLIPMSLPSLNDRAKPQRSVLSKLAVLFRNLPLLSARLVRHAITFIPTLVEGVRWCLSGSK